MGKLKGGTNTSHSKEEKLGLVKRNLAGESLMALQRETGVSNAQSRKWTKQYLEGVESAFVHNIIRRFYARIDQQIGKHSSKERCPFME